jgi:hypothetical protein
MEAVSSIRRNRMRTRLRALSVDGWKLAFACGQSPQAQAGQRLLGRVRRLTEIERLAVNIH